MLMKETGCALFLFMVREVVEIEIAIRRASAYMWCGRIVDWRERHYVQGQDRRHNPNRSSLDMHGGHLREEFRATLGERLLASLHDFVDMKLNEFRARWETCYAGVMVPQFTECSGSNAVFAGFAPLPPVPANTIDGHGDTWLTPRGKECRHH